MIHPVDGRNTIILCHLTKVFVPEPQIDNKNRTLLILHATTYLRKQWLLLSPGKDELTMTWLANRSGHMNASHHRAGGHILKPKYQSKYTLQCG